MFGLKLLMHSALTLLSYAGPGTNGDIMPPMVGGQRDSNDCLIGAGFTWCEETQNCIRRWETPCADNFSDCSDCLKRQRNGENIACPIQCDTVLIEPPLAIDPLPRPPVLPPPPPPPMPHLCSEVMCMMYCENGNQIDENGCNICACNTISPNIDKEQICPIPYEECSDEYVCPKITEITTCGEGGIRGYTTYQLSLILNPRADIRNIYALFGKLDHEMILPGSYQVKNVFGKNLGGVPESTIRFSQNSIYDSWLTIGITDGDIDSKLGAIGIDFESWDIDSSLVIDNGAVFLQDPNESNIGAENEIIIAQLTLPNDRVDQMLLNVQGKLINSVNTWAQYDILFNISPPVRSDNLISPNCISWFDGCNTCRVNNGVLGACTRIMCFREEEPYCINTINGH